MLSKKGISIIAITFIVLISSIAAISWIFYNTYFGSRYQLNVLEQSKLDTIFNEIEKGKNYLRQSLIYSSHESLSEFAASGGNKPWICNTPNYPTLVETSECLANNTKYKVNTYFKKYSIDLPLNFNKEKFRDVKYIVTSSDLSAGKYDNGDFDVEITEGGIILNTEDISITDGLNLKKEINKNRFWYMYNRFKEWSKDNVFGQGICDCVAKCSGCSCAKKTAETAFNDLRKRFDKHVSCRMMKDCCVNQKGGMCQQSPCLDWKQNICSIDCEMKPTSISSGTDSSTSVNSITGLVTNDNCYQIVPVENKLAAIYTYECEDERFFVPGENGPHPLTFRVNAFASFRDLDGCKKKVPCGTCPGPCICPPEPSERDEEPPEYNPTENPASGPDIDTDTDTGHDDPGSHNNPEPVNW
ncbi:MAG: hypothetical protein ABEK17_00380 [Candidatus Aenigmatarchaeota archaeon]